MVKHRLQLGRPHPKRRVTDRRRHGFERGTGGDDDARQSHQGQYQPADNRRRLWKTGKVDEDGQAQDTEHDGWHSGKIGDVHLNQVGPAVLRRKLFQIDRCGNADGQRQHQHDQHHIERPDDRHAQACCLGPLVGRIRGSDEAPVEPLRHDPGINQLF